MHAHRWPRSSLQERLFARLIASHCLVMCLCLSNGAVLFTQGSVDAQERGIDVVGVEGGREVKGQKWAVIIGINDYETAPPLRYSVPDAKAMCEALTSPACGFRVENIRLLVDDAAQKTDRPTRSNLIATLSDWLSLAHGNDIVLVYFSGHGKDSGNQSFLLPSDVRESNLELTGVSLGFVHEQLRFCKAKRKILILDMCHAGGKGSEAMSATADRLVDQSAGFVTLASCKLNEVSWEWEERQRGVFSFFLTDALRQGEKADKDKDGYVSIDELYDYVYDGVLRWAAKMSKQQTPKKKADVEGKIYLARAGGASLQGGIAVRTSVPGARVFVDGVDRGVVKTEGLTIKSLTLGAHKVMLKLEKYRVWIQEVEVAPEEDKDVQADLEPLPGRLIVSAEPEGATIYLDGQQKATSRVTIDEVEPGQHTVRVALRGHEAQQREVTLHPADTQTLTFVLRAKPKAKIEVGSEPEGAQVLVNGREVGTTNSTITLDEVGDDEEEVRIVVKLDGYLPQSQQARLKMGDVRRFKFILHRLNPIDGAEMVWIPAGEFFMGSEDYDDEKPPHRVFLEGYWIYVYEVTVAQYRTFCQATSRPMPPTPEWGWQDNHPIVNVSWKDAEAYCERAGARLPTEAEWEKAARGADGRKYPWGSQWSVGKCAHNLTSPKPVGRCFQGASPYGVYDMAGNVGEWCADWYDPTYYKSSPAENPNGPATGTKRVVRGGSWSDDIHPKNFRCSDRNKLYPVQKWNNYGFRCVCP